MRDRSIVIRSMAACLLLECDVCNSVDGFSNHFFNHVDAVFILCVGVLRCDSFILTDVSPKGNHNDNASLTRYTLFITDKVGMVLTYREMMCFISFIIVYLL